MKTTTTHVSVHGVMPGLGAPDEHRRGGFERGGWAMPLFDNEAATFLDQVYGPTPKGLTIQVYRPTGRPQYATATAD